MVASSTSETSKKKKSNKRKRTQQSHEVEKLDSLKWNSPLSADDNDPFALLVGSNELDGGFLSLEEIDEVDYNLQIPKAEEEKPDKKPKSKKWKHSDAGDGDEGGGGEKMEEEKNLKIEKAKKKKKKKRKKTNKNEESVAVHGAQDDADKELVDEAEDPPEYDAWNELMLHPSLMKSIYRLGFKEPTPIQKACIPAAADQGKDVIGAAKTGSGKMLAFGLPIIRL